MPALGPHAANNAELEARLHGCGCAALRTCGPVGILNGGLLMQLRQSSAAVQLRAARSDILSGASGAQAAAAELLHSKLVRCQSSFDALQHALQPTASIHQALSDAMRACGPGRCASRLLQAGGCHNDHALSAALKALKDITRTAITHNVNTIWPWLLARAVYHMDICTLVDAGPHNNEHDKRVLSCTWEQARVHMAELQLQNNKCSDNDKAGKHFRLYRQLSLIHRTFPTTLQPAHAAAPHCMQ